MPAPSAPSVQALALALALAGCIAPQDGPAGERTTNTGGEMTAKETRDDQAALCTDNIGLTTDDRFCATRTIKVTGELTGISKMDVDAETFNGFVHVTNGKEGAWALTAVLTARGSSADEAKANLDDIQFEWAHVDGTTHFVSVAARHDGGGNGYGATLDLVLPRAPTYVLVATTSNGAVDVEGLRTDGLAATTSNGAVTVDGDVTQADLRTSNGALTAKLRPTASGRITLSTSNGAIALGLPEDATRGYDLEGTTSNGEVEIALRDGQKGDCPEGSQYYTPPCTHRTFRTSGYEGRAVQTLVKLQTSNGDVSVTPG